jgi:DnaK suppressor protein
MNQEQKDHIREDVTQRIAETEKTMETLREQAKPVPPSVALGRLTRMDAIQQKSMAEKNLRTSEQMVTNLKEVLKRIDEPGFGTCISCKEDIPPGRILVVPESRVCIRCASGGRR